MTWAKVDDNFFQHPKAIAAGPLACALYVGGLCYCNRYLTDGYIPAPAVRTLVPGLRAVRPLARHLVKVGLWETTPDGWHVHDFLTWNERGADIKAHREATRNRVANWRRAQKQVPANSAQADDGNAVTELVTERVTNAHPTPTPTPTPLTATTTTSCPADSAGPAREILDWLNRKTGKNFRPKPVNLNLIKARLADGIHDWQLRAIISRKAHEWRGTEREMYLRPKTLFNRTNCEQYIGELPKPQELEAASR